MPVLSDGFLRFELFLRQLVLIPAPAVLGNQDGLIRALRKVRSSNETDNFIESISQMVPRWSPDGPQMQPILRRSRQRSQAASPKQNGYPGVWEGWGCHTQSEMMGFPY